MVAVMRSWGREGVGREEVIVGLRGSSRVSGMVVMAAAAGLSWPCDGAFGLLVGRRGNGEAGSG